MDSKALRLAGTPLSGRDLAERAAIQKDASIPFEQVRADLETIRQPVLYGRPHAQPDRPWAGEAPTPGTATCDAPETSSAVSSTGTRAIASCSPHTARP
ncbi:hypothetical protein ACFRIB_48645 [Streptomyces mirabilis]|uniref:hypothetical protein n=1 Tax=Streptomyces mirabilis TaxID=68239 RepID=UPI0036B8E3E5